MASQILFPGDLVETPIPPSKLLHPSSGLYRPTTNNNSPLLSSTLTGTLTTNPKKKLAQIHPPHSGKYVPRTGDLVIAQIQRSGQDIFFASITPHSPLAILPQLAFEGASKKTRPQLKSGDLVYARVLSAERNMEVELTCVDPATGKAAPEGLGPITGGMVFDISGQLAGKLLKSEGPGFFVLEELGRRLKGGFEVAVGVNGRVCVECEDGREDDGSGIRGTCAVDKALRDLGTGEGREDDQNRIVTKALRAFGLG